MSRMKLGVLISGRGSNLQALIDAARDPAFPAEIVLVLSNKAQAFGLQRAKDAGIAAAVVSHRDFSDRAAFDACVDSKLRDAGVQLVCLAGFMRLLTPEFVAGWGDRIINVHPSLLPSFPGVDTYNRAIQTGVRFTGCTVHVVRAKMDDGPILVQAAVPVAGDDDEDSLAARILEAEHRAYVQAVRWIAEDRVHIQDERALIDGIDGVPANQLQPAEALPTPTLSGRRVRLVPLTRAHGEPLARIVAATEDLAEWMPDPLTGDGAVEAFVAGGLNARAAGRSMPFAILDAGSGEVIGTTRFGAIDMANRRGEIGWTFLARSHQGTGANDDAKLLLLGYAFERLGWVRVEFKTDARNGRSQAALAKIGATREGTLRQHLRRADGSFRDSVYFSVLDTEWPAIRAALLERLGRLA